MKTAALLFACLLLSGCAITSNAENETVGNFVEGKPYGGNIFTGVHRPPQQIGPGSFSLKVTYGPATSLERARLLVQLELGNHAKSLGYGWISGRVGSARVTCSWKEHPIRKVGSPVISATATYSHQPRPGFASVDDVLAQQAEAIGEPSLAEKEAAMNYWVERCKDGETGRADVLAVNG